MKTGSLTPISDWMEQYRDRGFLRLHMPGHKGAGETEALDLTEVGGLGPLYPAEGIVRESEDIAAELFGAGRTLFSAEGSSLCIRAMVMLARMRAEREGLPPLILAGRNAHRTFLSAAAVLGVEVRWLSGENLLTCRPTGEELEAALRALPAPPAAVYLTSPDYAGHLTEIRPLAEICRARGIPLLVDNAHGAYLRFLPRDLHPLSQGADMTCDSAHKTLPALTGAAYLQISRKADPLFAAQAERALSTFASTSPSWLILRSLDRCNALLAGEYRAQLAEFTEKADRLKQRLSAAGFALVGEEPLKISLAAKSCGYRGDELAKILWRQGISAEFADPDLLVLMLTPSLGEGALNTLETALLGIPRRDPLLDAPPPLPKENRVMPLARAMLSPAERVPVSESLGRVLADPSASCPPEVPILVSGEVIGEEALRCFEYYGVEHVRVVM